MLEYLHSAVDTWTIFLCIYRDLPNFQVEVTLRFSFILN